MKPSRLLVAALAAILVLAASIGCNLGGAQEKPGPNEAEVRKIIQDELRTPEAIRNYEKAIQDTRLKPMIEEVLQSDEGKKLMREAVKKQLESDEVQKAIESAVAKAMKSDEVKKAVQTAVTQTLQQIIQKGSQGGGEGQQGGGGS
ncbi:MAG: hypothetical protein AB1331_05310 [Bacillota bacterium]